MFLGCVCYTRHRAQCAAVIHFRQPLLREISIFVLYTRYSMFFRCKGRVIFKTIQQNIFQFLFISRHLCVLLKNEIFICRHMHAECESANVLFITASLP